MPKNKSTVPLGTVLEGKLRLIREIGRGGMAAVYEAENVDIGKRVAVKVLAAELISSRIVRERFIREARAAAAIRSPHICDVYDSGMYEERPFLVMELLEGESLYELMSRERQLSPELTVNITRQTAKGLQKAHDAGIIHRDLKPENIFLTKGEDGELLVKILDFGLARFYEPIDGDREATRLTREGALFGTPAYMSPEQSKGQGGADYRCDLWALGCIVYECLTGQTVWNIDDGVAMIFAQIAGAPIPRASRLRPDLGPAFDRWFGRALDRDPDQRFPTARAFAEELALALASPDAAPARASQSSSHAVEEVDALLRTAVEPAPQRPARTTPAPVEAPPLLAENRAELATDPGAPPVDSSLPPASAGTEGPGRAIGLLLAASTLVLGAYGVWFYGFFPPGRAALAEGTTASPRAEAAPKAGETEPYALQIGAAQSWLERGDIGNAQTMFNEAFENGGEPVARSLLAHAKVLGDGQNNTCKVNGLGRPRPFDRTKPSSRPSVALAAQGAVVAWVDAVDANQQAQTVLLDKALRRASQVEIVSPQASAAKHPQLFAWKDALGLLYWDVGGARSGLYVQPLEASGRARGDPSLVAPGGHLFNASLSRAGDEFFVVWEEQIEPARTDIVVRPLDENLIPLRAAARLAVLHRFGSNVEATASRPDIAVVSGRLHVVFAANRSPANQQIMALSVSLDDPALAQGLGDVTPPNPLRPAPDSSASAVADAAAPPSSGAKAPRAAVHANRSAQKGRNEKPRTVQKNGRTPAPAGSATAAPRAGASKDVPEGQSPAPDSLDPPVKDPSIGALVPLSSAAGKDVQPRIGCLADGCVVAWDEEGAGAHVVFMVPDTQEVLWRRAVGEKGVRPAVGVAAWGQIVVVWYESSRVLWASADRGGLGPVNLLTRVSGYHPYPDVVPGFETGQWWVAFQDFEAGHFETFVVRAQCPGKQ